MKIQIRRFRKEDAGVIAFLIRRTLFEINSKDYRNDYLETIAAMYTPEKLQDNARLKKIFTAETEDKIVGTATIHKDYISCVFVLPDFIGKGIGRLLMDALEQEARANGFDTVMLQSSLTAHRFYKQLGYQDDVVEELTIRMYKNLR
jgi:GNAT superfamily N-acetyltransferase